MEYTTLTFHNNCSLRQIAENNLPEDAQTVNVCVPNEITTSTGDVVKLREPGYWQVYTYRYADEFSGYPFLLQARILKDIMPHVEQRTAQPIGKTYHVTEIGKDVYFPDKIGEWEVDDLEYWQYWVDFYAEDYDALQLVVIRVFWYTQLC